MAENLSGFFHELVMASPPARRLDETSRFYLGSLLFEMVRRKPDLDGPVCLRVMGVARADRPVVLKEAGDTALFVSGWFPEWGERRGLDGRYFEFLGAAAYRELSDRWFRRTPLSPVYGTLASRFGELQESLRDVRDSCARGPLFHIIEMREFI